MNYNDLIKQILLRDQSLIIFVDDNFDESSFIEIISKKGSINKEDITEFFPEDGVEVLRERIGLFHLKPNSSPKKLFIIHDADNINKIQANTLLKIIEEPPRYGKAILFARNRSKVITTILSRCHHFYLSSDKYHERESILTLLKSNSFREFVSTIKPMEKKEAIDLLIGGLEELKQKGLNKAKGQIFKQIGNSVVLLESTKCNHRLVLERLYMFMKFIEE